jgi:hypothetical protein
MWNRTGSPARRMVRFGPLGAEPNMEEPMAVDFSICEVRWERYRGVAENPQAREWLKFQATRGLAANTIDAHGRDLDSYLTFLDSQGISFESVVRPTIGAYVRSITDLAVPGVRKKGLQARTTLAHATLQQHLTVVRLFQDYLVEERICVRNPLRPAVAWRSFIQRQHRLRGFQRRRVADHPGSPQTRAAAQPGGPGDVLRRGTSS